jgi:hypothetical protein
VTGLETLDERVGRTGFVGIQKRRTAERLGLESTLKPRGRPRVRPVLHPAPSGMTGGAYSAITAAC